MPVMIQVRNVDERLHAALKERAAAAHLSLSDYIRRLLERDVQYRTNAEISAWLRERNGPPPEGWTSEDAARAVRESRAERAAELGWDDEDL